MTSLSLVVLFALLIVTIQVRARQAQPYINRRPWGPASWQREAVRLVLALALAVAAVYVENSLPFTIAAWAVALSWFPGAIRQSIRLHRLPFELLDAAEGILHERVPDLALLAVLVTPEYDDIPAWLHLKRHAHCLGNLPDAHLTSEDIPALRLFIEAAIFDEYASDPFNSKPGKTKILMSEYEMQTTLDLEFPDILQQVVQFVQLPKEQWAAVADSAMLYGVEAALRYGDIPIEYMDALAERRENVRLKW